LLSKISGRRLHIYSDPGHDYSLVFRIVLIKAGSGTLLGRLEEQLKQCRKPTSERGKALVKKMNEFHLPLTGWGLEIVQLSSDDIILDIGCGGGQTLATLAAKASEGKVFGIDHSLDCVNWSREHNRKLADDGRVEIVHAGVDKIPFKDNQYNLVVAVETIYFWPEIEDSFKEVRRILKPGGRFLIINEMYLCEAFRKINEECMATGEMIIYSPEQIEALLCKAGFREITIDLVEEKNWLRCVSTA
jgi:SAM-dependent methyltransferase